MSPLTTLSVSPFLLPLSIRSLLFLFAIGGGGGGGGGGLPEGERGEHSNERRRRRRKRVFAFKTQGGKKCKNETLLTVGTFKQDGST